MKVVIFCGGLGRPDGRGDAAHPEAHDPDRKPADPLGHHAVVRGLGAQRVRALPRLQGRRHPGVLPQLQRGALQRLRSRRNGADAQIELLARDIATGASRSSTPGCSRRSASGSRRSRRYLDDDDEFLATYGDGLTDAPLDRDDRRVPRRPASLISSSPSARSSTHHVVDRGRGRASSTAIEDMSPSDVRINGGFFVFARELSTTSSPARSSSRSLRRLIPRGELVAYRYEGFSGRWTRSRTSSGSTRCTSRARAVASRRRARRVTSRDPPDACSCRWPTARRRSAACSRSAATPDDIEIGCGGTLLALTRDQPEARRDVGRARAPTASAPTRPDRAPRRSSRARRRRPSSSTAFRDGFIPYRGEAVKEVVRGARSAVEPDLVFTHTRDDLHQDHRLACELTWNTFRDHLILEYEIPKYDGDLGRPNVFVPARRATSSREARRCCATTSRASATSTGSTARLFEA